jgi:hypothetical protein
MVTPHESHPQDGKKPNQHFDFTPGAVGLIREFLAQHFNSSSPADFMNACNIATTTMLQQARAYRGNAWFEANPIHAFEAMTCLYTESRRYAPVSLNLHYIEPTPGTFLIGTPEEMPLGVDYFTRRVIEESKIFAAGNLG